MISKTLIDFKDVIEKIHEAQKSTIMPLAEFRNKNSTAKLPSKSRGLTSRVYNGVPRYGWL